MTLPSNVHLLPQNEVPWVTDHRDLTSICHGLLTATAALGDGGIPRRGQFESGTSDRSAAEIGMRGGTFNLELNRTTIACVRTKGCLWGVRFAREHKGRPNSWKR